jgi:4-hydroxy-3-polyprenylbenzoate decarboxylase
MPHPFVLAITGASGAVYARRLLEVLLRAKRHVHLTISPSGRAVLKQELGVEVDLNSFRPESLLPAADLSGTLYYHRHDDFFAPIASGSHLTAGMVICPCSGSTLSAVAHGSGNNLIHRAADVHLKEHRKLIVVPRETPLSLVQIDNMKRVCELGGVVLPAMPGWYHGVESLSDLVDFVVARILDQLGVEHSLMQRWGSTNK